MGHRDCGTDRRRRGARNAHLDAVAEVTGVGASMFNGVIPFWAYRSYGRRSAHKACLGARPSMGSGTSPPKLLWKATPAGRVLLAMRVERFTGEGRGDGRRGYRPG